VSEDGRVKALSYDIASLSATERQCQMYPPFYALTGPFGLQISSVADPVTQKLVAWRIAGWIDRDETTIWMDGRPHPSPYAPHTHGGFTTGTWEGDTLTAVTTHFKMGDIKRHTAFSVFPLTACEPIEELPHLHENPGLVPHYLPGRNPWVNELTQNRNIPLEAVLGGPATMYPEFRKTIRDKYVAPERCTVDCGAPAPAPARGRGAAPPAGGRGGAPPR
jgi:hypothetical protein